MYGIRHMVKDAKFKDISEKDFKNIGTLFMKSILEDVFAGYTVRLPSKMGSLSIVGKKVKPTVDKVTGQIVGLAPDWKSTYALWNKNSEAKNNKEVVYFLNEHSQTIRYRFFWSKRRIFSEYKDFYTLVMCRSAKRALAKKIFNGSEYYVNTKNFQK